MPSSKSGGSRSGVVTAVCLAVAALAVFGALNSYQVSIRYSEQFPDAYGAARAQIRFAPLLSRISASAELGYLTDLDPSQSAYAPAFLAAQYALAPRQVVLINAQTRPEWAVGNFTKPQDFAAGGAAQGYDVAVDAGNGVILLHRK